MVRKSLKMRLDELSSAVLLLKDARERALAGDSQYLQVLSSQLRGLICSGSNSVPLLISLADLLEVELPCFGAAPPEFGADGRLLRPFRVFVSAYRVHPEQARLDLRAWLAQDGPTIYVNATRMDPNSVIRSMADVFGGAHYDVGYRPRDMWPLLMPGAPGQCLAEVLLTQVAGVVIELSDRVLSAGRNYISQRPR